MKIVAFHPHDSSLSRINQIVNDLGHAVYPCQTLAQVPIQATLQEADLLIVRLVSSFQDTINEWQRQLPDFNPNNYPMLILADRDQMDQINLALAFGCNDILYYPFSDAEFIHRLNLLITAQSYQYLKKDYEKLYKQINYDPVFIKRDGTIYQINDERVVHYISLYDAAELFGKSACEMIPPEAQKDACPFVKETLDRGLTQIFDTQLVQKNGQIIDISVRTQPIFERDEIIGFSCTLRNISVRKGLERDIAEAKEKYLKLFEQAGDSVFIVDHNHGAILDVNQQAINNLGYSKDEFLTLSLPSILHMSSKSEYQALWTTIHATGICNVHDTTLLDRNGKKLPVNLMISTLIYNNINVLQIIARDISQQKQLEKMKEDLTSMLVHDLKNPLVSIIMSIELLRNPKMAVFPETQLQCQNIIHFNSNMLLRMVHDILDIQRMEVGIIDLKRNLIPVYELVDNSLKQIEFLIQESNVTVHTEFESKHDLAYVDDDKMLRVITNIVSNALKFTPPDGDIFIKVERASEDWHVMSIKDTGEGIPSEYLTQIFEKFAQIEKRNIGQAYSSGLGLTYCKMAVESHGGKIWVESQLSQGSTFFFTFPAKTLV